MPGMSARATGISGMLLLAAASAAAQTPASPPLTAWTFSASGYTYIVPDESNYVQPTVTANRRRLHARRTRT